MKWFTRLLILAVPVILPGCYASSLLELDGLKPSEITISTAIQSLTVVSRCDLDSAYKVSLENLGEVRALKRDSLLAKQVVLGCSDALNESPRFDLFNPVVKRTLKDELSNPLAKIPWDVVRIVAGDPTKDAVLSLERGTINDTVKYIVTDGGWLNYFQYNVVVKTSWRLYRLADFQTKDFFFVDTIAFDLDSPVELGGTGEKKLEYIRTAMYEAGVKTGRRLAPWWTNFQRYYFALGNFDFMTGSQNLKEGKWRDAAEAWRPFTESSRKNIAAKACFNMSLTCEMANNIPAALDWLNQSEKLGMHDFYIKDYRSKLLIRKTEAEKLDEQMK